MPPKLRARDLSRHLNGSTRLVEGVSFQVDLRQVLAILGPSGAGKTSLLRMLNRLDESTAGRVLLDGRDHREIPPLELRRRVGYLAQSPAMLPGTVLDNVTAGPQLRGETVDPQEVDAILDRFGILTLKERDTRELSGGEKQRVALARALVNEPEVLLLDEPTTDLDKATEARVEELILGLVEDPGLACVVVTHDPDQAQRLGTRALRLVDGKVEAAGDPQEVIG